MHGDFNKFIRRWVYFLIIIIAVFIYFINIPNFSSLHSYNITEKIVVDLGVNDKKFIVDLNTKAFEEYNGEYIKYTQEINSNDFENCYIISSGGISKNGKYIIGTFSFGRGMGSKYYGCWGGRGLGIIELKTGKEAKLKLKNKDTLKKVYCVKEVFGYVE